MKILLVKPGIGNVIKEYNLDDGRMEPLSLGIIASLTPPEHEVSLVDEGGPWPFRLAENQLTGYLNLKTKTEKIFLERAESYRKMLFQILPLALSSRLLFRGENFKIRWKKFITNVRKTFPVRFYISLLFSPFTLALIIIMVGFGNLIYFINPKGGQPKQIKIVYPEM